MIPRALDKSRPCSMQNSCRRLRLFPLLLSLASCLSGCSPKDAAISGDTQGPVDKLVQRLRNMGGQVDVDESGETKHVIAVSLEGTGVSFFTLEEMTAFVDLRELNLQNCRNIDAKAVDRLRRLPCLESLRLRRCPRV